MASSSDIAKAYLGALTDHDLDGAMALWEPGAVERLVGQQDLIAPAGLRAHFEGLFAAFPDWRFELLDTTASRGRCVVRWRVRATFAGPGDLQGIAANGARIELEGTDVINVREGKIVGNDVYLDSAALLRQLGVLPPAGSRAEALATGLANLRSRARRLLTGGPAELIAPGVWILRGGLGHTMNVYLIEEPEGGVTLFDAGVEVMAPAVAAAAARLGGIRRIVLGHADCDHRGAAPALAAPVFVHELELEAAQSASALRDYWDLRRLAPHARPLYPRFFEDWDGGAVAVAGTVGEGDEIAGFRVLHLPGHAPGLIGLYREEDGLVLSSDTLYTLNVETGVPGPPRVPHPAFNHDTDQARDSLERLAGLAPKVVWAGHSHPVAGADVPARLLAAARA